MTGEIPMLQAKTALETHPNILLIDVRSPAEHEKGHIAGCINIPLDLLSRKITQVAKHKKMKIFVYCRSGVRGYRAKDILMSMGYEDVTNIGGILFWPLVK
jgi:rhodanese-related sulfurtransferase